MQMSNGPCADTDDPADGALLPNKTPSSDQPPTAERAVSAPRSRRSSSRRSIRSRVLHPSHLPDAVFHRTESILTSSRGDRDPRRRSTESAGSLEANPSDPPTHSLPTPGSPTANTSRHPFVLSNFKYYLTLFSKFFSSFPHGTCSLSVSHKYLALEEIYHPLRAALPSNPTLREWLERGGHPAKDGILTLSDCHVPMDFGRDRPLNTSPKTTIRHPREEIFGLSSSRFTRRY